MAYQGIRSHHKDVGGARVWSSWYSGGEVRWGFRKKVGEGEVCVIGLPHRPTEADIVEGMKLAKKRDSSAYGLNTVLLDALGKPL